MAQVICELSVKTPMWRLLVFKVWIYLWVKAAIALEKTSPGTFTVEFDAEHAIAWLGRGMKVKAR